MTLSTQGNQVLIRVLPSLTALLKVVHLKAGSRPTGLTSPPVASQHFAPQLAVQLGIQTNRPVFWNRFDHAAVCCNSATSCCCCLPGKSLNNRDTDQSRTSGLPLSRATSAMPVIHE